MNNDKWVVRGAEDDVDSPNIVVDASNDEEARAEYIKQYPYATIRSVERIADSDTETTIWKAFELAGENIRRYHGDDGTAQKRGPRKQTDQESLYAGMMAIANTDEAQVIGPTVRRAIDLPEFRDWMLSQSNPRSNGALVRLGRWMSLNHHLVRVDRPYEYQNELWAGAKLGVDIPLPDNDMDGRFEFHALAAAELFYVTPQMSRLIEKRLHDLVTSASPLTPGLCTSEYGMLFFGEPVDGQPAIFDSKQNVEVADPIQVVLWGPCKTGIRITTYEVGADLTLFPVGHTDWAWGEHSMEPTIEETDDPDYDRTREGAMFEDRARLLLFWEIAATPGIADVVICRPDRAARRRAARAQLPESRVRVVDLHAPKYESSTLATKRDVEWTHQYPVRTHEKMQAYGPGRSLRKRITIDEYRRGPKDKPFIDKETVFLLRDEGKSDEGHERRQHRDEN